MISEEITDTSINGLDKKMLRLWDSLNEQKKKEVFEYLNDVALSDETMSPNEVREYNEEILTAEKEIESGNFITHEEAMKQLSKWKL